MGFKLCILHYKIRLWLSRMDNIKSIFFKLEIFLDNEIMHCVLASRKCNFVIFSLIFLRFFYTKHKSNYTAPNLNSLCMTCPARAVMQALL